ncbi:hypothetical protein D3C84_1236510 [compost metagenome]
MQYLGAQLFGYLLRRRPNVQVRRYIAIRKKFPLIQIDPPKAVTPSLPRRLPLC